MHPTARLQVAARRGSRPAATDIALVHLVRLALDDAWHAPTAAARLTARIADDGVLRRARARVRLASTDRAGTIAQRMLATLDVALGQGRVPAVGHGPDRAPTGDPAREPAS